MWKVLICDDEAMTRRGLTKMIGHCRKDMEVVGAAAQGEEACTMIGTAAAVDRLHGYQHAVSQRTGSHWSAIMRIRGCGL